MAESAVDLGYTLQDHTGQGSGTDGGRTKDQAQDNQQDLHGKLTGFQWLGFG